MQPSKPGYNFTVADLERIQLSTLDVARVIMQGREAGPGGGPDISALLAAMLKSQRRANTQYIVTSFNTPAAIGLVRVLTENPNRDALIVQFQVSNATAGDKYGVLFEDSQPVFIDMTGQDNLVANYIARSILVSPYDAPIGQSLPLQFFIAPSNAVSIICNPTAAITVGLSGVVVEGVRT